MARAIVVDDDYTVRMCLSFILQRYGYEVEAFDCAASCLDAVAPYDGICHDLLITDIRMPQMDGLQMLQNLSDKGSLPGCVAIVSGAWTEDRELAAMQRGYKMFTKPIIPDDLLSWLEDVEQSEVIA